LRVAAAGETTLDLLDPPQQRPAEVHQLHRDHPGLVLGPRCGRLDVPQPPVDARDLMIVCGLPRDDLPTQALEATLDTPGAELPGAPTRCDSGHRGDRDDADDCE